MNGQRGVVHRAPAPATPVAGTFDPPAPIVMVKRPHTQPRRVEVVVGVARRFRGSGGTLDQSGDVAAIAWFDRAGDPIPIPAGGLRLTTAQLNAGFHMFAESSTPTQTVGGYVLTLTLTGGPAPLAPPQAAAITAVRLTLDLFPPGPTTGPGAPSPLPEPPAAAPAAGTATDKWFLGRTVNVQDAALAQGRARIRVRQVEPSDFTGTLSLRQRSLSGTTLGRDSARMALLDDDNVPPLPGSPPASGIVHANPFTFPPPSILGRDFFVEGRALSSARRDVAYQLGLDGGERDGDRVALTIGVGCSITVGNPLRAVLVRKPPASPARQVVTLRTNVAFPRTGLLDRSLFIVAIALFRTASGGAEIAFDGVQNRFTGAELSAGLQLFAEGRATSIAVDDYVLSLTLADGSPPAGLPATAKMTAVELTLDACLSRPLAGGDPPVMPAADRRAIGRFVQVTSPTSSHERTKVIVRPPNPNLACELVLRALGAPPRVQLFRQEEPAAGQTAVTLPDPFLSGLVGGSGLELFAEGTQPSANARDTGLQLGIVGIDDDGDRAPMTALEFAATENDTAAAPALSAVRFGLWDQGYDAAGNVRPDFVDNDRRRFHFQLRGPLGVASIQTTWRTVSADRTTADDAPASEILTLSTAGAGRLVSRGGMLVTDDIDSGQTTASGLIPPLAVEPRTRGLADHRLRRAQIDGFVRARVQPSVGQLHHLTIPVFDRAVPFDTTAPSVVAAGVATVVPAAMSGTASTGARWQIKVGSVLAIDSGPSQEEITVTAVTPTSFTATFARAHDGSAAPFRVAGTTDERRRLAVRVVRYLRPGVAGYAPATPAYVATQFERANLRWKQVGLQIAAGVATDRTIPPAALDGTGLYSGSGNNPQEQAALLDLIPVTPDNTLTVVYVHFTATSLAAAYATLNPRNPIPLPAGGTLTLGDRYFIFMGTTVSLEDETLAHELHHVIFNRGDAAVPNQFFTFNTNQLIALGLPIPDVRIERRIQNQYSADPNVDPANANVINWVRRQRTARFPLAGGLGDLNPAANAETGNLLTADF